MILTYYTATTMIIIAYLLGSIPSAVWIGKKYYGIDIREYGSKNAGTTNMLRVLGRRAALPVFGLDFLKGFVAVTIIDLMKYDSVFADGANENWFYILRFIAVFAAAAAYIMASYVLEGFSIACMRKKAGDAHTFPACIPFYSKYLLGKLADRSYCSASAYGSWC